MARVTVKQKLQALQQKYSIGEEEAKDILSELEKDFDRADLAEQWQTWWKDNGAVVQANAVRASKADEFEQELVRIKQTIAPDPELDPNLNNQAPNFDPSKFAQGMFKGMSTMTKDIQRISYEHMTKYKEMPDYDAIEKLVEERGMSIPEAYSVWVAPKARESFEKETKDRLQKEFDDKFEAEKSKLKFPSHNQPKASNTIVRSFLDRKPDSEPSEQENLDAFIQDLNTPVGKAGSA